MTDEMIMEKDTELNRRRKQQQEESLRAGPEK